MAETHIVGSILGTAVGDAMGLPYEGLSRRRATRLFGAPDRHRFLFGRGMVSDDTEHTCIVAQSIIASRGDVDAFQRQLSWRLRLWLLGLPAGTGLATLRAILRLWIGFSPGKSGVFSAGNGPAMRAPIIGAAIDDLGLLRRLVRVSTRITHTDAKAEYGALAVALASRMARQNETVAGSDFLSVPVSIHAWLSNQRDFRAAVTQVVECGGDTDSTGAVVGGIVGAAVGRTGIPPEWIDGLCEWPRSVRWMERLATQVESALRPDALADVPVRPIGLPAYGVLLRNLFFLTVVLYHGFRRTLPPY